MSKQHKTERKLINTKERKRKYSELDSDSSSDSPAPYKYKNPEKNYESNKNQSKPGDLIEDDMRVLEMSSTDKLMEAKECIRLSIQREEKRNTALSFEDDLRRMKEQLSETLRR